jgi:Domain of unknown function (DUF5666)
MSSWIDDGKARPTRRGFVGSLLLTVSMAVGGAALMTACGGGGSDSAAPSTPPSGTSARAFTEGAITGFGSVIVAGVRFDDRSASVIDDDGIRHGSDDLKLGMSVSIASSLPSNGTATAQTIRFGSEIVGSVTAVNVAESSFTLIGQTVDVTAATVFDDSLTGGMQALRPGLVAEVYASFDAATGRYVATRIEDKNNADAYRVRGIVSALDTAARSFRLGDALISYASARDVPTGLANGQWVRVKLRTTPVAGAWVADEVKGGRRGGDDENDDFDEAEVQGTIDRFTSTASFSVNGLPVDASAASFPAGQAGIALGALVEVEGAVRNGVLIAKTVKLDDEHGGRGEADNDERFELHGVISALDTTNRSFMLRGVKVSYAGTVAFDDGSEADLRDGAQVEVKGRLSADGSTLDATRIDLND